MTLTEKIEALNLELIDYFNKRGWGDRSYIFLDNQKNQFNHIKHKGLIILPNYFLTNFDNGIFCRWWSTTNVNEFITYCYHFMEHVAPFYKKYDFPALNYVFYNSKLNGCILINGDGKILDIIK